MSPSPHPLGSGSARRHADHGLLAERVVLDRLGLHPGDSVRIGNAAFTVRGTLLSEPDRAAAPLLIGPRALISLDALPSTGLIVPGSMVQYAVRATLPDPARMPTTLTDLRRDFPGEGWRIRDPHDAAPGVTRFIDQTSLFLTLVGLTSLLVGGIGVANGVRAWLDARARTIATLRCLGARPGLVLAVCLVQVLGLAVCGIAIGLVFGAFAPDRAQRVAEAACCRCHPSSASTLGRLRLPLPTACSPRSRSRCGRLVAPPASPAPRCSAMRSCRRDPPARRSSPPTPRSSCPGRPHHRHLRRSALRTVVLRCRRR